MVEDWAFLNLIYKLQDPINYNIVISIKIKSKQFFFVTKKLHLKF